MIVGESEGGAGRRLSGKSAIHKSLKWCESECANGKGCVRCGCKGEEVV